MAASAISAVEPGTLNLEPVATFPRIRVLAWHENDLYASCGYDLLRAIITDDKIHWHKVARFRPPWWRTLTAASRLSFRAMRDGFHALAVLPSGHLVAALPGAIATLSPGETEFRISHHVLCGTRPLHVTSTPDGKIFWGEYFDNPARNQVHVYVSEDKGATWHVAYTFPAYAIRHIHNIVYDEWRHCFWILTGDNGAECRILCASCDLKTVDVVLSGSQQARTAALVPTPDAVYFSSDTPHEQNYIYCLDSRGRVTQIAPLPSSSIYGCRVSDAIFFSTMIEPSRTNPPRHVHLFGSLNGLYWQNLMCWKKDRWPMKFFQYGNTFLPDGRNATDLLALTTIAVTGADQQTILYRIKSER